VSYTGKIVLIATIWRGNEHRSPLLQFGTFINVVPITAEMTPNSRFLDVGTAYTESARLLFVSFVVCAPVDVPMKFGKRALLVVPFGLRGVEGSRPVAEGVCPYGLSLPIKMVSTARKPCDHRHNAVMVGSRARWLLPFWSTNLQVSQCVCTWYRWVNKSDQSKHPEGRSK